MTNQQATVAELEAQILAGDLTVTAEQLEQARIHERHAELVAQACSRAEIEAIEAQRQEEIEQLRADIAGVKDEAPQLQELADTAARVLDSLVTALADRNHVVADLARRARALGIAQTNSSHTVTDPSGIGWAAGHGRNSTVILDGRVITGRHPLDVLDKIFRTIVAARKLHERTWRAESTPAVREQLAMMDHEITAPTTVALRVHKRWGQYQPGQLVQVDPATAKWAAERGIGAAA
jgi:hypothetical protein